MNLITILFFFLISSSLYSQDQVVVGVSESRELYRNYHNKIQVAFTDSDSKELAIKCENCDTIYPAENNKNEYIIVPGMGKYVTLFITNKKNKKVTENNTVKFRVINLPEPSLFFGVTANGSITPFVSNRLFAKYPPEIWMNATFDIINWEITINEKVFKGEGNVLNEEVIYFLKNIQIDSEIKINATYKGMGNQGLINSQFTLLEKSKQKENNLGKCSGD